MLKSSLIEGLRLLFSLVGLICFRRTSGLLFHGYMGEARGNTLALYEYILSHQIVGHDLCWTGKVGITAPPFEFHFKPVPERNASILAHLSFLLFLMRFRVIVCESAGDLSFYIRFIPRRSRLRVLLLHGFCLKACGVLSPALSSEQRKIWSEVGEKFDLFSVSSKLEQYMLSATFNGPVENFVIMGPQRELGVSNYRDTEKEESRKLMNSLYGLELADRDQLIFYAPTHRDHQNNKRPGLFGFEELAELNEILIERHCYLFVREHARARSDSPARKLSNIIHTNEYSSVDFSVLAPSVNGLITDYSGIFLEYLKSSIRLGFWHYDISDYRESRGFSISEDIFKTGRSIFDRKSFCAFLDDKSCTQTETVYREMWYSLLYETKANDSLRLCADEIRLRANL